MPGKTKGFSLIELMMTVAILAILAVIAVPSYMQHMRRSNRTDAMAALMRISAEQEKFYFQNSRYGTLAELGSPTTENGLYTLAVSVNDANTFTATATADTAQQQKDDDQCQVFSITAEGIRTALNSDLDDSLRCWR